MSVGEEMNGPKMAYAVINAQGDDNFSASMKGRR
jgi:hypothetical protein